MDDASRHRLLRRGCTNRQTVARPVERSHLPLERSHLSDERRRRLTHRAAPALAGIVVVVLLIVVIASSGPSPAIGVARNFTRAWERSDYTAMYALLTPEARRTIDAAGFAAAYRQAADTATATGVSAAKPKESGSGARVDMRVRTRIFGVLRHRLALSVKRSRVAWSRNLVFPGLRPGETLTRRSDPPPRAEIQAQDGRKIVSGPARSRVPSAAGRGIAGQMGLPRTEPERNALYARGFPKDQPIGQGGLERILEQRIAGSPGGTLLAGRRVIARARSRASGPVRTTIDLGIETAAVSALGARLGGVAALDPKTGQVRALAGIAFSGPQPPGSTFKLVTLSAVLTAKVAKPTDRFPVRTRALIDGVPLENANGESCGGTLVDSFVNSCNSVFAPLGLKVGAKRLVDMAERYGFNDPAPFPGARPATIPKASGITSDLDLGSTAIGQGKVLATPLEMASIAQAIAAEGVRYRPTIVPGPLPFPRRAISRKVAHKIREMMVEVVKRGTGTSAALAPGEVAGKTGTAELGNTRGPGATSGGAANTDAWFACFAPANNPRIAVGVMLIRAGAGGQTAAPVARQVLATALRGGR